MDYSNGAPNMLFALVDMERLSFSRGDGVIVVND
jgi:hypothetical protein